MIIVKPRIEILSSEPYDTMLRRIEAIGRVCYKSEDKIREDSAEAFIRGIIKRGHESVIEHGSISVRVICDRGVTHEIVRHRLASYSQESTRYCNYASDKFSNQISCIDLATGSSTTSMTRGTGRSTTSGSRPWPQRSSTTLLCSRPGQSPRRPAASCPTP